MIEHILELHFNRQLTIDEMQRARKAAVESLPDDVKKDFDHTHWDFNHNRIKLNAESVVKFLKEQ